MNQDKPKFDPSLTQESMLAEHHGTDLLADIVKAIPPMPPEHGTKVIKNIGWLINQARALDKQKIEELETENTRLKEHKDFLEKFRTDHIALAKFRAMIGSNADYPHNDCSKWTNTEWAKQTIDSWKRDRDSCIDLESKVQLLKAALKPAAEKWRYSGFTKAGANPTTEYFDIRVTREELAAMHTAYHDT